MKISGKTGFLNYQDLIMVIKKKVERQIDMRLNLKLTN